MLLRWAEILRAEIGQVNQRDASSRELPAAGWRLVRSRGPFGFAQGRLFDFAAIRFANGPAALRMTRGLWCAQDDMFFTFS
jgi:hypothetical protein